MREKKLNTIFILNWIKKKLFKKLLELFFFYFVYKEFYFFHKIKFLFKLK